MKKFLVAFLLLSSELYGAAIGSAKPTQSSIKEDSFVIKNGDTVLHIACAEGDLHLVKSLLNKCKKVNLEEIDNYGRTPLHIVCIHGHLEIVQFLLDKGSNVYAKSKYGITPLGQAGFSNHVEVEKLLEKTIRMKSGDAKKYIYPDVITPDEISDSQETHKDFISQDLHEELKYEIEPDNSSGYVIQDSFGRVNSTDSIVEYVDYDEIIEKCNRISLKEDGSYAALDRGNSSIVIYDPMKKCKYIYKYNKLERNTYQLDSPYQFKYHGRVSKWFKPLSELTSESKSVIDSHTFCKSVDYIIQIFGEVCFFDNEDKKQAAEYDLGEDRVNNLRHLLKLTVEIEYECMQEREKGCFEYTFYVERHQEYLYHRLLRKKNSCNKPNLCFRKYPSYQKKKTYQKKK